jgi:hypothetical protein
MLSCISNIKLKLLTLRCSDHAQYICLLLFELIVIGSHRLSELLNHTILSLQLLRLLPT